MPGTATSCTTFTLEITEIQPVVSNKGELSSAWVNWKMKGPAKNVTSGWKILYTVEGMQTIKYEYSKADVQWWGSKNTLGDQVAMQCDQFKEFTKLRMNQLSDPKDNLGNDITDPNFFNNKKITLTIEDETGIVVAEDDKVFNSTLDNSCLSSPLDNIPQFEGSSFNGQSCSCDFTITYSKNPNLKYTVFLYEGNTINSSSASNALRVIDESPRNITAEITEGGRFTWAPLSDGSLKVGTIYLQIGIVASDGKCLPSTIVCSEYKAIDATCLNKAPVVEVRSFKRKPDPKIPSDEEKVYDYTKDKIELVASPPLEIGVYAKTDDKEVPKKIKIQIYHFSETDLSVKEFYLARHPADNLLRTIEFSPTSRANDCIYYVPWDGRDDFDKRILVAGYYQMVVTAYFNIPGSQTIKFKVGQPKFVNIGNDYPLIDDVFIAGMIKQSDKHDFNNVDILRNESVYLDYEWLRQFSIMSNKYIMPFDSYIKENLGGNVPITTKLLRQMQSAGFIGYIGHAGVTTSPSPDKGFLIFRDSKLLGGCSNTPPCKTATDCDPNTVCLNKECYIDVLSGECNALPLTNSFEDVAVAVILGCKTAVGTPSVASQIIEQGADCVIATKCRVDRRLMSFYYRNLSYRLFEMCDLLPNASSAAYDMALKNIAEFYTNIPDNASFDVIQTALGTHTEDGVATPYILPRDETITIIANAKNLDGSDILTRNFQVPRHGAGSRP
jgi:hypothetical protein